MGKDYRTIISRLAENDVSQILDYYRQINEEYAQNLLTAFEEKIMKLKSFPAQGRIVPELEKQNILDYRELIEGNFRIIYAILDETVVVHTVVDSRRNLEELLIHKLTREY